MTKFNMDRVQVPNARESFGDAPGGLLAHGHAGRKGSIPSFSDLSLITGDANTLTLSSLNNMSLGANSHTLSNFYVRASKLEAMKLARKSSGKNLHDSIGSDLSQYYRAAPTTEKSTFRTGPGQMKDNDDTTSSSEEEVITRKSRNCIAGVGFMQRERVAKTKRRNRSTKNVATKQVDSSGKTKSKQVESETIESKERRLRMFVTLLLLLVLCPMTKHVDATKLLSYLGNTFAVFLMIIAPAFIADNVLEGETKNTILIRSFYGYACVGALGFCSQVYIDVFTEST